MNAAQAAFAGLVAVLIAGAVVLIVADHPWSGWIFGAFGLLGFLGLLGMIITDRTDNTKRLPPPPRP